MNMNIFVFIHEYSKHFFRHRVFDLYRCIRYHYIYILLESTCVISFAAAPRQGRPDTD